MSELEIPFLFFLHTNTPPKDGQCEIKPKKGNFLMLKLLYILWLIGNETWLDFLTFLFLYISPRLIFRRHLPQIPTNNLYQHRYVAQIIIRNNLHVSFVFFGFFLILWSNVPLLFCGICSLQEHFLKCRLGASDRVFCRVFWLDSRGELHNKESRNHRAIALLHLVPHGWYWPSVDLSGM